MTAWASNDKPVRIEEMPGQAQKFIKDYFSTHSVAMAKMETDFFSKSYDVIFTNGDKVEFDRKGNWTDVDCKYSVVPVGIVPTEIVKSVKSKYPDAKIIQIERDNRHYDVDLSNGWELKYNKQFKLVDIEK
jgi:hypothetical protein